MAAVRQMTPALVAEVVCALKGLADVRGPQDMGGLSAALRASPQKAFSDGDLRSLDAGVAALQAPAAEKSPPWRAAPGRGLFLVFEGLDRSGKSTQSRLLREHLEKVGGEKAVKWMCFPNRDTTIGCLIDLYLRRELELSDGAIHLLFSANRWEMAHRIVDELNAGTSVVCDRYAFSGVAYSAAKGLDFEWCQAPDIGLPCPDAVFFMRVDPKVGASRANFGDERYENETMQANVRAEFQLPRLHDSVNWNVVDGSRSIDEIHEEIRGKVEALQRAGRATTDGEGDPLTIHRLWASKGVTTSTEPPAKAARKGA